MADVVAACTQGHEKFNRDGPSDVNFHGNLNWKWNQPNLPVREHNCSCQQHTVDRPRRSNGGNCYRQSRAMWIEECFHQDVDEPRANSCQEEIDVEPMRAPGPLQIRSEHPQEQHVEEDVQDTI